MANPGPETRVVEEILTVTVESASSEGITLHKEAMISTTTETTVDTKAITSVQVVEETTVTKNAEAAPAKAKKAKKSKDSKEKAPPKAPELPFYQSLGQRLCAEGQEETACDKRAPEDTNIQASSASSKSRANATDFLHPSRSAHHRTHSHRSGHRSDVDLSDRENSVSTGSMSDIEVKDPSVNSSLKGSLYNLDDFKRLEAINQLIAEYGTVSHMSVRDPSYSFWINRTRTAAVHFKLLNKVAVLAGDPLCPASAMPSVLEEFERYCRKSGWKTSVIGASEDMLALAKLRKWPVMRFGTEKVLNPMTNEVLLGKSGKRTAVQCKQLIDPAKGGLTLHVYIPSRGRDLNLEAELTKIYDDWRGDRNTSRDNQAFITVFEMFSMPHLMTFIYTKDGAGAINGFAALRKMGSGSGSGSSAAGKYHIDPFIQAASAPRGTSDLLIFASLAYLNALGSTYLGLGHEPVSEPDAMWNMNSLIVNATRKVYRHIFGRLPVGGKETFNSRWKPDSDQEAGLYLIFIGKKTPSPKHLLAMTHFANISLRNVLKADWMDFKHELRVPVASPGLMLYAGAAQAVQAPPIADRDRDRVKMMDRSVSTPATVTTV
ncbi:hypothetical protein LTR96_008166 [Exophiala xenobiotica]|uniref:Phosphatidylglycerol lysyltransferase C-terminal domain-containing protein n=1 Tax=Vermiconidia calcicola TaxID=1690605 RepID=A0AAV9PVD0_9PEZI|nr:hypothetical protein LTR41_010912 [Exophiala xenobiotica]KAK5529101.1 hypothetical protein LTR25_009838 [Vermiconidia calcicola]KAK5529331.1 hypothetical protein LTR23_010718 [Chaetothyriales sp. CCFEE 6169]KAK5225161.1 hypothetical protein LTR47_009586 [Exophiala xenobiotica]KAK5246463.1 hypothetical protein LTS06_008264 [Exophiala xenobiotica]